MTKENTSETSEKASKTQEDSLGEEKNAPKGELKNIFLEGNLRTRNSISMLFTDILSQELNSALVSPETMGVLQKYLQKKPLENMNPSQLEPLMNNIPDTVLDVVKEALFCSGVGNKRIDCQYKLEVGDPFLFRGSALMGELSLLDGKVVGFSALKKR